MSSPRLNVAEMLAVVCVVVVVIEPTACRDFTIKDEKYRSMSPFAPRDD